MNLTPLLAPLSWAYAAVMDVRNWMFSHGWLRERRFDIPVICIGNLAVGGTGKTPHCEWLVGQMLDRQRHVAILSRGYGRKTRGYHEATATTTALEVGDEPLQMFCRFGGKVIVAVCEDRCRGIELLTERHPELDLIVLDDAFQHRYVCPALRILLTDYSRPFYADHVMPYGRLREKPEGADRADIIIVTKCPDNVTADEQQRIRQAIAPKPHQHLYFTTMEYAPLPWPEETDASTAGNLVIAGIANPSVLIDHLNQRSIDVTKVLTYRDHHNFTATDIAAIERASAEVKRTITTAKDFARIKDLPLNDACRRKICVQDLYVKVLNEEEPLLMQNISAYVD